MDTLSSTIGVLLTTTCEQSDLTFWSSLKWTGIVLVKKQQRVYSGGDNETRERH